MLKTGNRVGISMMNTIRINYEGMRAYLQQAVIKTNELLRTREFYDQIAAHPGFDMADINPMAISELMSRANINMAVDLYYSISPFRNIDGYDDAENPALIHINIWTIQRPVASLCNTLVHSCVHAVNALNDRYYFGHGDITLDGKENTAPYQIGSIAQDMISKGETRYIPLEHDMFRTGVKYLKDFPAFN